MKPPSSPRFALMLRHLSPDGAEASASLPSVQLPAVSEKELLGLLRKVAAIASVVEYPAEPEIRIMAGAGQFVVRVRAGLLHLVSWSAVHKGGVVTPEEIVHAVTGAVAAEALTPDPPIAMGPAHAVRAVKASTQGRGTLVALALAIVTINAFTVWFVTQPRRTLASKYRVLSPEQGKRVIEEVAGIYETGKDPGDRRIEVHRDASMHRVKYGPAGKQKDPQSYTVQAADASGQRALVTNRKSLVIVRDPISLELYGDTYKRVAN